MRALAGALLCAVSAAGGCLPVAGDRILARDLEGIWPALAALDADTPLGLAPAPGVRRLVGPAELVRLARRYNISAPPAGPFCLERPLAVLAEADVRAAMQSALAAYPGARLEILELSHYPVPRGELAFPAQGLQTPAPAAAPRAPLMWRGEVRYGEGRRFAVWARVILTAPLTRVRAAVALKPGEIVRAGDLRLEKSEGFPGSGRLAQTLEQVVGRQPRRTIPAGGSIPLDLVADAPEVQRGETVRVEVASGPARLALEGRAESSGSRGETVRVRNPASQRVFAARVSGKGTVVVDAGGERP